MSQCVHESAAGATLQGGGPQGRDFMAVRGEIFAPWRSLERERERAKVCQCRFLCATRLLIGDRTSSIDDDDASFALGRKKVERGNGSDMKPRDCKKTEEFPSLELFRHFMRSPNLHFKVLPLALFFSLLSLSDTNVLFSLRF